MTRASDVEHGSLVVRLRAGAAGRVYWDAQWRFRMASGDDWRLKRERLGLAWQEPDGAGGWRKRKGRCPEGWLDERAANIEAAAAMERHALKLTAGEQRARDDAQRKVTVRELAHEWLRWLEEVYGAKPSTLSDYRFLLREPGLPHKRGAGVSHGRIMGAFGDRAAADVTTAEVSRFCGSWTARI